MWAIPAVLFFAAGVWYACQHHPLGYFNAFWCLMAAIGCLLTRGLF